jgi:nucleotide-binding universal stress UspA family protein
MPTKKRKIFEQGHRRKYVVVVDESPEVDAALYFAANRVKRTGAAILLCYVIEPQDYQHWMGVKDIQRQEEANKAAALFRLFRRKLGQAGFDQVPVEEVVREGNKAEQIRAMIEEDEDVGVLVLGASMDPRGPGPLVSSLAGGRSAGTFPVPITVVPGNLTADDIAALA